MKILKYLFLLAILFLIALTIFVATLNPDYKIVRTNIVNVKRSVVFEYVNNLKNWEYFDAQKIENSNIKFSYSKNTVGNGAYINIKNNPTINKIEILSTKKNETINQIMFDNDKKSEINWIFKDTLGKTKISCIMKGKLGFWEKMYVNFAGGSDKILGENCEKSLSNINKNLDYELRKYQIIVNGYLQKTGGFYLHKTVNSKNENVAKNIQIMIKNLLEHCNKNNITTIGKPFVIYNTIDEVANLTNFSVCIFINRQIIISPETGYSVSNLIPFQAVKVTLTGDYRHFGAAREKALDYFYTFKLKDDNQNHRIEVYVKTKNEIRNPSEWITEIYFPANTKTVVYKPSNNQVVDTNKVATPEIVTPAN